MLKLSQILSEDKNNPINKFIKKCLYYMCQEEVSPSYGHKIYNFLTDKLFLKDEKEIVYIIKLYQHNFSSADIARGNCVEKELSLPEEVNYSNEHMALAEFLGKDPFFLDHVTYSDVGYLSEYFDWVDSQDYKIGEYNQSMEAAKQKIRDIIWEEGYEYFDVYDIDEYIETNEDMAQYDAEERAKLEQIDMDEDDMRIDLYVDDEYKDLLEDRDFEQTELDEKKKEIKIIKFKLEKLNKEKKIIEREIETLGFSLDYEDDGEYFDSYNIDISEMTDNLNELEGNIYEYLSYIDDTEKEIYELEKSIDNLNDEIDEFVGDSLVDKWIEHKTESYLEEYVDDPLEYVDWSRYSIAEAEIEGLINIDKEGLINSRIEGGNLGNVLASYDNDINKKYYNGVYYYIFRN